MMRITKIMLIAFGLLSTTFAYSQEPEYWCEGKVDHFQVTRTGHVQITSVDLYEDWHGRAICNMSSEWQEVTPASCKAWVAMILASKATDTKIRIQYYDDLGDCSSQPTWGRANAPWMIQTVK